MVFLPVKKIIRIYVWKSRKTLRINRKNSNLYLIQYLCQNKDCCFCIEGTAFSIKKIRRFAVADGAALMAVFSYVGFGTDGIITGGESIWIRR